MRGVVEGCVIAITVGSGCTENGASDSTTPTPSASSTSTGASTLTESSTVAQPGPGRAVGIEYDVVFRDVDVFDGTSVLRQRSVALEDGRIAAVETAPAGWYAEHTVDGAGMTLLPGLIDAHTHVFLPEHSSQAARFGVTTQLDMLADPATIEELQAGIAAGTWGPVADLRSAGNPVLAPNGFGTNFGIDFETLDDPADAHGFVGRRVAEGSDYLGLLQDDGSIWGLSWIPVERDVVTASIAAAHAHGLMAVAHAPKPQDTRHALEVGVDGMMSMFVGGPDPQLTALFETRGAFMIPTLTFLHDMCGEPVGPELADDPDLAPRLDDVLRSELQRSRSAPGLSCAPFREGLADLVDHEIAILAGTDAPQPGVVHGASLHAELVFLVEAGMTPSEALAAATSVPARAFSLTDRGRLQPGMRADLVLVHGDPSVDITRTRAIEAVWIGGARVPHPS